MSLIHLHSTPGLFTKCDLQAKTQQQKGTTKPFEEQKRERVEAKEKVEKTEKPKKKFKQEKLSFLLKGLT